MRPCIGAAPDTAQSATPVGRLKFDLQKKTNFLSKSTAPFLVKLVGLEHMYIKVWNFWAPAVYGPHGIRQHTTISLP